MINDALDCMLLIDRCHSSWANTFQSFSVPTAGGTMEYPYLPFILS